MEFMLSSHFQTHNCSNCYICYIVKTSANIHMNDVNFKHIIEHTFSCTLERVDKNVSYVNGLKFGTIDEDCLIEATSGEQC